MKNNNLNSYEDIIRASKKIPSPMNVVALFAVCGVAIGHCCRRFWRSRKRIFGLT